jgi:hypothetical protein
MLCNYVVESHCLTFVFEGSLMIGRASDIAKYYIRCILIVSYNRIKKQCMTTEMYCQECMNEVISSFRFAQN